MIERTCCHLQDFCNIATRYDKTVGIFLAAICLFSAITAWA